MAGGLNKLSPKAVQHAKEPGYYGDGGGLWLQISKLGGKSWVFRFTMTGKAREMGLGSVHTVTLAEARTKALECRKAIADGRDPIEERKAKEARAKLEAEKTKTFEECANAYIEANRKDWKNEKHVQQWQNTLATYAFPKIGQLPVAAIDTGLVLSVLQQETGEDKAQLWHAKAETASRLRGRIEVILDWAAFRGYREGENPARWKGHLDNELNARSKARDVEHHPSLPYVRTGAFMVELRKREGIAARALEFAILCASRSGEIREATWAEIDLPGRVWTIPKGRMKAEKEHRVPLSDEAVKLLEALPHVGTDLLFPAPRGGELSNSTLNAVIKRMHEDETKAGRIGWIDPKLNKIATQHGFRSTFRDWAGETTAYPREVCEHALAHKLADGVEAAYQRGDLLAKRARLMADWARYCGTVQGNAENVVAMKKGAA